MIEHTGRSYVDAHEVYRVCPRCQGDVSHTTILEVVYTFEPCTCGRLEYLHLVEQLWHRRCFLLAVEDMAT
jgi:hypothetical protein